MKKSHKVWEIVKERSESRGFFFTREDVEKVYRKVNPQTKSVKSIVNNLIRTQHGFRTILPMDDGSGFVFLSVPESPYFSRGKIHPLFTPGRVTWRDELWGNGWTSRYENVRDFINDF